MTKCATNRDSPKNPNTDPSGGSTLFVVALAVKIQTAVPITPRGTRTYEPWKTRKSTFCNVQWDSSPLQNSATTLPHMASRDVKMQPNKNMFEKVDSNKTGRTILTNAKTAMKMTILVNASHCFKSLKGETL